MNADKLGDLPDLTPVISEYAYPVVFATISGAHLYGFPSIDSDVDLRGVHLLPRTDILGLAKPVETVSRMWVRDGIELDLVTHDLRKFARLLLRPNGYVLEQLLSPLIVHTTPVHAELLDLVPGLLTRAHAAHYRGFAVTQWRLFTNTGQLKPLLYTFRVLLTGINLMRAGVVVADLPTLASAAHAPNYLTELIAAKRNAEHGHLADLVERSRLQIDVLRLHAEPDDAEQYSTLADQPSAEAAIDDVLVRARC